MRNPRSQLFLWSRWVVVTTITPLVCAAAFAEVPEHEPEHEPESAVIHTAEGEVAVKLSVERQHELEMSVAALEPTQYKPEACAVGRLEADPAHTFILRAPLQGIIRVAQGATWTGIGDEVPDAAVLGWIEPRLSPLEQVDLASRYAAAKSDVAQAEADLAAAKASFDSKRALNTDNKIVTDRAMEEARAKVAGEQARFAAATEIVHLIEAAQGEHGSTPDNELRVALGGEIVELLAQVGETVDRGQVILKIVNHATMLARVELPIGTSFSHEATTARIVALDDDSESIPAQRVSIAPRTAGAAGGAILLYRLEAKDGPLRAGARVLAYIPTTAEPQSGVIIPRAAVVRDAGRAWVYVQTDDETFVRRGVPTLAPTPMGWFAAAGFKAGDKVVIDGSQMLLSEELKPQIEKEEAAEE